MPTTEFWRIPRRARCLPHRLRLTLQLVAQAVKRYDRWPPRCLTGPYHGHYVRLPDDIARGHERLPHAWLCEDGTTAEGSTRDDAGIARWLPAQIDWGRVSERHIRGSL